MSKISKHLRPCLILAESIGEIDEIHQGDWLDKADRIDISGKTQDGREFILTLEIEKEVKQDA